MQITHLVRVSCVAGILASSLVACDKPPESPASPSGLNTGTPAGPVPPQTQQPSLARLELAGPDSIAPGSTAQFTLTAFYTDGSSADRTSQGSWRTSNSSMLSIAAGGLATGRERGEVDVAVSFGNQTATKAGVLVLPEGTFRLRGAVRDTGIGVVGAEVEISEGPHRGRWTWTQSDGTYVFYGVGGDIELSVTRNGYQAVEKRIQVTGNQTYDIDLVPAGSREIVQGRFTLKVWAASECGARVASDLLSRTYAADIAQIGPQLAVTLGGATFYRSSPSAPALNRFNGTVGPGGVDFQIDSGFYYYGYSGYRLNPEVAEQVAPTTIFSFYGWARLTRTSTGYAGTLNGGFATFGASFLALRGTCYSRLHGFELIGPER